MSPLADIGEISVANNARICCSCAPTDVYLLLKSPSHVKVCLRPIGEADLLNHQ
jgi:hypothetical protein